MDAARECNPPNKKATAGTSDRSLLKAGYQSQAP
jgi:hypothetical protein